MTGGMAKYWIIPRVADKELPHVGHLTGLLQSPHILCSYKISVDYIHDLPQDLEMKGIIKDTFGVFHDLDSIVEVKVDRYTLTSPSGVEVQVNCGHFTLWWMTGKDSAIP